MDIILIWKNNTAKHNVAHITYRICITQHY